MKNTALKVLLVASVFAVPAVALAQESNLKATVITKEDIDKVNATEQNQRTRDENVMVVNIGPENFALGVIHRASTHNPPPAPARRANAAAPEPCGRQVANPPAGGIPGGITHDHQTEGYYIISGGGTMMIDGYIANGRHSMMPEPGGPNGPSCGGMAYGSRKVDVKVGDVVIVPAGVVHGWADIPDHVDYLSFRPSEHVMQAGWVNPTIAKK